jgi:hypothetical protein
VPQRWQKRAPAPSGEPQAAQKAAPAGRAESEAGGGVILRES